MQRKIYKSFSGECPNNGPHSIDVEYLEVTSLDSPTCYIKGRYSCSSSSTCETTSNCPLYNNAPNQL